MSNLIPWKADDIGNVYRDTEVMRDDPIGFFHDPKYAWQARDAVNSYAALMEVAGAAENYDLAIALAQSTVGIVPEIAVSVEMKRIALRAALDELKKVREVK